MVSLAACSGGAKQSTTGGQVDNQESTTTTVKAPSVKVAKSSEELAKALNISVPDGYVLQPDNVGDTGPSDLEKAAKDDGGADARDVLTRTGFVRGYQRMWSQSATDQIFVYVYQFGDAAGAADYTNRLTADATAPAPGETVTTFTDPIINGAVGVNTFEPSTASSSVTFVKGPYSAQVVVNGKTPTGLQALATALAEEQYSRL
jgi:hypothetical protein